MTPGWVDDGVAWRSGAWSLERRGDELADLAYDGRVVLRSIRAVVRDRDWNTAEWSLGPVRAEDGMLRIALTSTDLGSDIRARLSVDAHGDTLTVGFDAESALEWETNRTGLVVLHPPQLAGEPLRVRHPDGSQGDTAFPVAISAHQPVFDIAGLAWSTDGLDVEVDFEGDVFEMEDQRNWTDASYKTYNRPLSLPFPYRLAAGAPVHQRIAVSVRRTEGADPIRDAADTVISLRTGGAFPRVGVSASTAPDPAPYVAPVGGELLVELDLRTPPWRAALERAAASGLPLDVRVVLDEPDPAVLEALAEALRHRTVARVAVFHPLFHVSTADYVHALRAALASAGITALVAGGSRAHFTELNRERDRMPDDLDEYLLTLTPLFHSLSPAQLRESVGMQRHVAVQSVGFAGGRPVRIGPISLRPRFNDAATGPQPGPERDDLSQGYGAAFVGGTDERQSTAELAAWTIASAAALAVPGVAGLTYFEQWGPRGIRAADATPYPVAAAVAELALLDGTGLLHGDSPDDLVWAVGSRGADGGTVVLAANLDLRPRTLTVTVPSRDAAVRSIPVALAPLAWARLSLT
jgi:D-apionolactonase